MTDYKVQIGTSSDYLDGVVVDTTAGTRLFRETVVLSDPTDGAAKANVRNTTPNSTDYGQVVRVLGAVNTTPIGTPSYVAGGSGTATVPALARITAIVAHSTNGGSVSIAGGANIPIPANASFFDSNTPYVGGINIVFTGTDSYYVAWVL
jgi:hypothetical protein